MRKMAEVGDDEEEFVNLIDEEIGVECAKLYNNLYGDNPRFLNTFLSQNRVTDIDIVDWTEKEGFYERQLKYTVHPDKLFAPTSVPTIEIQRKREEKLENNDGIFYVVETEARTQEHMYADCFHIKCVHTLTPISVNSSRFTGKICVIFTQHVTMKNTIQNSVIEDSQIFAQKLVEYCKRNLRRRFGEGIPDRFLHQQDNMCEKLLRNGIFKMAVRSFCICLIGILMFRIISYVQNGKY